MGADIRLMAQDEFWIITALLLALCLGGASAAYTRFKRARLVQDTPTSRIRSAAQGYVELAGQGVLLTGSPIVAPLTRRLCVWWRYRIEEKRTVTVDGKRQTRWDTIDRDVSDGLFQLVDETGDCLVDPVGAEVIPSQHQRWYGHSPRPTGPPRGRLFGSGRYRYTEELIRDGDALLALGWFRTERRTDEADLDGNLNALLAQWKQDQTRMASFDADGDGTVDLNEWEAARRAALLEVRRHHRERASEPEVHVLSRPADGQPFVLSTIGEAQLVRRYRWQILAGLAGFFAGGAGTLLMLTERGLLN